MPFPVWVCNGHSAGVDAVVLASPSSWKGAAEEQGGTLGLPLLHEPTFCQRTDVLSVC